MGSGLLGGAEACAKASALRRRDGKIRYSMKIAIGADHAGFGLKREIAEMLREAGTT
jgi:hypothetical protein